MYILGHQAAGFPGNFVSLEDAKDKKPQEILDEVLGTLDLQVRCFQYLEQFYG